MLHPGCRHKTFMEQINHSISVTNHARFNYQNLLYRLPITIPANVEAVWFLEFGPGDLRCRYGWSMGKLGDMSSIYSAELGTDLPASCPWKDGIHSCCFGRTWQACMLHVGSARARSAHSWSLVVASSLKPATFSAGHQLFAHAEQAAGKSSCYVEQSELPAQSWRQAWLHQPLQASRCPFSLFLSASFQD